MRVAYGVHGYGRGHAARSLAILSELARDHEVQVFTGGDAAPLLAGYEPVSIPVLAFGYRRTRLSLAQTLLSNASILGALALAGGPVETVEAALDRFRPEAVVSDSEPLVLRAAGRLGIPRIGVDHVGIIAWCRPAAPPADALELGRDALMYRLLMGHPERVVVSSFFEAPPRRPDVTMIPPVLRTRVFDARPIEGEHLLVYLNRPQLFTREVQAAISGCGAPAIVYGAGREGREGSARFKRIDEAGFVEDLASARAVLATSGHQLASEALHLGKPMLLHPEETAEQRLNARELVRLGVARCVRRGRLTPAVVRGFLAGLDAHRTALQRVPRDGNVRALAVIRGSLRPPAGKPSAPPVRGVA